MKNELKDLLTGLIITTWEEVIIVYRRNDNLREGSGKSEWFQQWKRVMVWVGNDN